MSPSDYDKHAKEVQQMVEADIAKEEAEKRKEAERENRQGDAAYERMVESDKGRRDQQAQQARQAREAQARQLAEKQRQQASKPPPALNKRTPTHTLDRGR